MLHARQLFLKAMPAHYIRHYGWPLATLFPRNPYTIIT
jgi:hypothetical protein